MLFFCIVVLTATSSGLHGTTVVGESMLRQKNIYGFNTCKVNGGCVEM